MSYQRLDPTSYKKIARQIVSERDSKEFECLQGTESDILTPQLREMVLAASAMELREMMANGTVKCVDVVRLFAHRARRLGLKLINCVTEEMYDAALEQARAVDKMPQEAWKDVERYPLLGVPVSVKDMYQVANTLTTCGAVAFCDVRHSEDGLLIRLLREAGAIPLFKTNVPQLLMMISSVNHIWGLSTNPWDQSRTVGGSSGGEAGALAVKAAPLGLGSDIGGSSRTPALFCGTGGFKPSPMRVSGVGKTVARKNGRNGQTIVLSAVGPMGHHVVDMAAVMRVWLSEKMFASDPAVVPIPFDNKVFQNGLGRPLRIAYFVSDGWFEPCSAVVRAVNEAAEALRVAGHHVQKIELPAELNGWVTSRLYYSIVGAEGNMRGFTTALQGEPLMEDYASVFRLFNMANFLRPLLRFLLRLKGEHRSINLIGHVRSGGLSTYQFWECCADLEQVKRGWLDLMQQLNVDAFLYPGLPLPALSHPLVRHLSCICTYVFLGNLLQWPVVSLPTTCIRHDEQSYPIDQLPQNQRDSFARYATTVMQNSAGLPVGVQLMTAPFRDELCLYAGKELQRVLPFKAVPPVIANEKLSA